MTKEQKVEAYRMRLDGATLQAIADKFGVSLEWVRQIIPPIEGRSRTMCDVRDRCVYPAIAQWLYDNHCTYVKLAEMIGAPDASVSRWMNGKHKLSKPTIDKILEVTGLTYEQAFAEADTDRPEVADGTG